MELAYATIWESIADAIPDRSAVVQGDRRLSWADYDDRAARLAGALAAAGLGRHSKVALYLYNSPEYCEATYAAMKLRGVPVNVNYRYLDEELAYLIENSDAEAVVFHSSLAERVAVAKASTRVKLWIEVDDGGSQLDGVDRYEDLIAAASPAARVTRDPDDHYILYTGGTTGMPKGVVYRQGPMVAGFLGQLPVLVGEGPITDPAAAAGFARRLADEDRPYVALPACPLMHGTGAWAGLYGPHLVGGTTVLTTSRSLDPGALFSAAERERATLLVIVGDPFARPLLRELDERAALGRPYDLASLRLVVSSGAMFSSETKAALCEHLPQLLIIDTIGSSEGIMGSSMTTKGATAGTARFSLLPTTKVFTEDGREVRPGSGELGLVAAGGNVPLGYYKDEAKTAATFKEFDGVRYSIAGDWATVAEDGTIVLLGRGGSCINSGGEKVFPEEVEEAIKTHPAVDDCLVFSVPDEDFGEAVASVAAPVPGQVVTDREIIDYVRTRLAAYKAPRQVAVVDAVPRTPAGKADYPGARGALQAHLSESQP